MRRKLEAGCLGALLLLHCMPDFESISSGSPEASGGSGASGASDPGGKGGVGGDAAGGDPAGGKLEPSGGRGGQPSSGAAGEGGIAGAVGAPGDGGTSSEGGAAGAGGVPDGVGAAGAAGHGEEGGSGGAGGGSGDPFPDLPPCGGCARLTVPFTTSGTAQGTILLFSSLIDLSGGKVVIRLRSPSTVGASLQVYAQDEAYSGVYDFLVPLGQVEEMTEVTYLIPAKSTEFNPERTRQLIIAVLATSSGPWDMPPVVDIDSVTISDAPGPLPDPFTFDAAIDPLALHVYAPVFGSTLEWIP